MWSILQEKWQEFQLRTELGLDLYVFLWSRLKTDEAIIALKTEVEGYSDEQLLDICGRCYFQRDPTQELVFWLLKKRNTVPKFKAKANSLREDDPTQ